MTTRAVARNAVLNMLDLTFLDDRALGDPSVYGTAVSTVCDLKCPHCMREVMGIRENAFMDADSIAAHRDAFATARRVSLFGLGEPFLNPRFFDIVRALKETGVEVSTTSHGMSLKPETRAKIFESGLDEVNVSMDGAEKELFERLRVNAKFDVVTGHVTALCAERRERGLARPHVNVNMTVMKRNVHQAPELVRLVHRMGADSVSYSSMVVYREADFEKSVADTTVFERYMEEARSVAASLGIPMSFWRQKPKGWAPDETFLPGRPYGCSQLWSTQIVEPDGRMKLCCYIEEDVANVFALGPREAFNVEANRRARRALMNGAVRPECQGCVYLRERSPAWIQSQINEAARLARESPELTEDDRRELLDLVRDYQARKDALHPRHRCRRPDDGDAAGRERASAVAAATNPPVY